MSISLSIALIISLIIVIIAGYYIIQTLNHSSGDFFNFSFLFIIFILILGGFALSVNWLIYFWIN